MFGKIALVAASLAAFGQATNLENYSFDQFVAQFDMHYHPSEVPARKALFEAELARVKSHNAQNKSWKETITRFAAMTPAEKTASYGRKASKEHSLKANAKLVTDLKIRPVSELPATVDWRNHVPNVVTAVKDQGYCGSCWAFASTAVMESHVALNTGLLFDLSPQQVAMCSPNPNHCGGTGGCEGATAEIAFEYVASAGIFQEWQYSYQSYYGKDYPCTIPPGSPVATIQSYVKLPENNYTALMNAIATVGPIAVSVDASAWGSYSTGVFNGCNQKNPDIDHAVVLMGYGEENGSKYWLVRNSWSPNWGESGYIKLLRSDSEEENCGMDTTPHDGSACDGQDEPVKVCGTCGILYDSSYPTGAKSV